MKILAPNNFILERTYIIDVLLGHFLGLIYTLDFCEVQDYNIILNSGKKLIIKDAFFNQLDEKSGYLYKENIPQTIKTANNQFLSEADLPIIFGNEELIIGNEEIICNIDIFASSFFMLTRWEEIAETQKDSHQRFPDNLSLAQRCNFHLRPIVNEYVEMLWNILKYLEIDQTRKTRNFEIFPTHDIDFLLFFKPFTAFLKSLAGDLLKRHNFKLFAYNFFIFFKRKLTAKVDIYDTFDYLMDISEKNKLKSIFFFIAGKKGESDVRYNFLHKNTKRILDNIQTRGHKIGIHGSYSSYNNQIQFQEEMERFSNFQIVPQSVRQHFLRFSNPLTWQIHENCGISNDFTLGFSNSGGFRTGVCYDFPVFDVLNRKKMNIVEFPLIAMDTAIFKNCKSKDDFLKQFIHLKQQVQKYNGQFVFLWHNTNFFLYDWRAFADIYPKIFSL